MTKYMWRLAKEAEVNTRQMLGMDDTYDGVRIRMEYVERQADRTEELTDRLHMCCNALDENIKWQSDYATNLHYGLVEVGGLAPFHPLTLTGTRHKYTLERGHIVARDVMGADRYLALLRQQNHGIDLTAGQTDNTHVEQAEEEYPAEVGETVEARAVPTVRQFFNGFIMDLCAKQNEMPAGHEDREAADIQRVILAAFDVVHIQFMEYSWSDSTL